MVKKKYCTICKFYKRIFEEKKFRKKKDEKHTCYLKIIGYMYVLSKEKTPTELLKLKRIEFFNIRDKANIMKIISTWPMPS